MVILVFSNIIILVLSNMLHVGIKQYSQSGTKQPNHSSASQYGHLVTNMVDGRPSPKVTVCFLLAIKPARVQILSKK